MLFAINMLYNKNENTVALYIMSSHPRHHIIIDLSLVPYFDTSGSKAKEATMLIY